MVHLATNNKEKKGKLLYSNRLYIYSWPSYIYIGYSINKTVVFHPSPAPYPNTRINDYSTSEVNECTDGIWGESNHAA